MTNVVKLSPEFLSMMKDRGVLRGWMPPILSEEEMKKRVKNADEKRRSRK